MGMSGMGVPSWCRLVIIIVRIYIKKKMLFGQKKKKEKNFTQGPKGQTMSFLCGLGVVIEVGLK